MRGRLLEVARVDRQSLNSLLAWVLSRPRLGDGSIRMHVFFCAGRGCAAGDQSPASVRFADRRIAYQEPRFVTLGLLRGQVVVIATAETDEEIRVISIRKAERQEEKIYYTNT